MGFDAQAFLGARFEARIEEVRVPELAPFFGGDAEAAVWRVRGLTGEELARANEAAEQVRTWESLVEALAGDARDRVEALRALLGLAGDVPADLVKRIEMLVLGTVEPRIDRPVAVRLADAYPVEFYQLTNAILRLTGRGKVPGKPGGSGATPASEPR